MAGSKGGGTAKKSAGAGGGGPAVADLGGGGGGGGGPPAPFTAEKNELPSPPPVTVTPNGVALSEKMTKDEREAIDGYSQFTYRTVNLGLREGMDKIPEYARGDAAKNIATLNDAMAKSRLEANTTVYRGTNLKFLAPDGGVPKVGTVFTDKGFVSTSRAEATASFNYFGGSVAEGGAVLRIHAPRGTKAIDVSYHAGGGEKEILLNRGLKYKVTGVSKQVGGKTLIDVTVIH